MGRNWSNFANTHTHTHTHTRVSYSSIDLFMLDPEGPMIQRISNVVGLQIIRYCYHVSDATLARQVDRFVAVSISSLFFYCISHYHCGVFLSKIKIYLLS